MKKMTAQCDKLNAIMENINDIISDLENEKVDIEQNIDEDRDMNYIEQVMYDELNKQISSLEDCVAYIENAMDCLEYYTD